jgi:hypothetical protein
MDEITQELRDQEEIDVEPFEGEPDFDESPTQATQPQDDEEV